MKRIDKGDIMMKFCESCLKGMGAYLDCLKVQIEKNRFCGDFQFSEECCRCGKSFSIRGSLKQYDSFEALCEEERRSDATS